MRCALLLLFLLRPAAHTPDQLFADWAAAMSRGDADALASMVTEDAEFWSHDRPPLIGRDAVAAAFREVFATYKVEQRWERVERIATPDLIVERGIEVNTVGGTTYRARAFTVLRRGSDGRWRFARGITTVLPR